MCKVWWVIRVSKRMSNADFVARCFQLLVLDIDMRQLFTRIWNHFSVIFVTNSIKTKILSPPTDLKLIDQTINFMSWLPYENKLSLTPGAARFQCEICYKMLSNKYNLKIHIRDVHEDSFEGGVICEYCNKTFSTKSSLRTHINNYHRGFK